MPSAPLDPIASSQLKVTRIPGPTRLVPRRPHKTNNSMDAPLCRGSSAALQVAAASGAYLPCVDVSMSHRNGQSVRGRARHNILRTPAATATRSTSPEARRSCGPTGPRRARGASLSASHVFFLHSRPFSWSGCHFEKKSLRLPPNYYTAAHLPLTATIVRFIRTPRRA